MTNWTAVLVSICTLAALALGFIGWVFFIAQCVKVATAWGWLP